MAQVPPGSEKRRYERFPCGPGTSRELIAELGKPADLVPVRGISAGGIDLVRSERINPGTLLPVRLWRPGRAFDCSVPVRFVYAIERPQGGYLLGGAFARPLNEAETRGLL